MPALVLFGRRWHIASDDLPAFTLPGAAFHATWAAFLAAALAIEPGSCSSGPPDGGPPGSTQPLRGFLAAMLAADTLQAVALSWLTHVGLHGGCAALPHLRSPAPAGWVCCPAAPAFTCSG